MTLARPITLSLGALLILSAACTLPRDGTATVEELPSNTTSAAGGGLAVSNSSASSSTGGHSSSHGGGNVVSTSTGSGGTGGGPPPVCGNGAVESPEQCDPGPAATDGCINCVITAGWVCSGQPSSCAEIQAQEVEKKDLGLTLPDGTDYDGSLATMVCVDLTFVDQGFSTIQKVELTIAVEHYWVGDLVVKLQSPANKLTTVLSRPGKSEGGDDNTQGGSGHNANLALNYPIRFADDAIHDAETMGQSLSNGQTVCDDDLRCDYFPNPGAGPGSNLALFNGDSPVGQWTVCIADADDSYAGYLQDVHLSVLSW